MRWQEILSPSLSEGGGFLNLYTPDTTSPPHESWQLSQDLNEEQREVLEDMGRQGNLCECYPPSMPRIMDWMTQTPRPHTYIHTQMQSWPPLTSLPLNYNSEDFLLWVLFHNLPEVDDSRRSWWVCSTRPLENPWVSTFSLAATLVSWSTFRLKTTEQRHALHHLSSLKKKKE